MARNAPKLVTYLSVTKKVGVRSVPLVVNVAVVAELGVGGVYGAAALLQRASQSTGQPACRRWGAPAAARTAGRTGHLLKTAQRS